MTAARNFPADPVEIIPIAAITYRLIDLTWPFALERAAEIEAHWQELLAQNPHLFNGRVLLMRGTDRVALESGNRLDGTCFLADYKAFLAWRDFGFPDRSVANVFAMAALRSADGAFLVGEMGSSTANAGLCYFPSGTPDPDDLDGCVLDLEGSVRRELREETGLDASVSVDLRFDPDWTVVLHGPYVACMKTIRSVLSAAELVANVDRFLAREQNPELARLKPIFSADDFGQMRMPEFMRAYMRHIWSVRGTHT